MCSDTKVFVLDQLVKKIERDIDQDQQSTVLQIKDTETMKRQSFGEHLREFVQIFFSRLMSFQHGKETLEVHRIKNEEGFCYQTKMANSENVARNLGRFLQQAGDSFCHRYNQEREKDSIVVFAKWFGAEIIRWTLSWKEKPGKHCFIAHATCPKKREKRAVTSLFFYFKNCKSYMIIIINLQIDLRMALWRTVLNARIPWFGGRSAETQTGLLRREEMAGGQMARDPQPAEGCYRTTGTMNHRFQVFVYCRSDTLKC